jgi:hypothetical protein
MSNITGCALSRLRFAITGCALSRLRFAITGCALLRFAPWLTVIAILSASAVFAQAPKPAAQVKPAAKAAPVDRAWTPPRTPWGDPDLQGVWNNATSTPLERPDRVGAKTVLSDEEAGEFQQELANQLSRDRRDGPAEADVARAYNEHWMDSRRLKIADRRTSLIVDPPDGHIPALVPPSPERSKAKAAKAASNTRFNAGMPDTYRDFTLPVRCIIRTDSPPYLPIVYNNDLQIFQGPGYVAIAPEMIHSARIIPLDGRPHLGKNLHQWLGDTRGHWEGNTLVVETTNFRHDDGVVFQDANPETFKLVERFTRVGPDTVNYEFTVSDPTTWTRPWTAMLPWTKIDPKEQMYEYACHEDNYDEVHFLAGARAREKKGETK